MTRTIFDGWLKSWDKQLQTEQRKVALLVDNCSAHKPTISLKNVSIFLLPPNTTSILQPCDMGETLLLFFYESQVRRLMSKSPRSERHLENFRASCVGQLRELVNLFFAPMRNLSTSERVEKAITRLRKRYGVLGGLITEPEMVRIRTGSKVVHTVASLKAFNEDLITLEVFVYAHDEVEKLSGQLLIVFLEFLTTSRREPYMYVKFYLAFKGGERICTSTCFTKKRLSLIHVATTMLRNSSLIL